MTANLVNFQPASASINKKKEGVDLAIVAAGHCDNIDPCHICHHRSAMTQKTYLSGHFSIGRHAVQQLLRQALDASPEPVRGLLGGREHTVEAVLPLDPDADKHSIRAAIQAWQTRGLHLLAAYSSGETARLMATAGMLPSGDTAELPQLIICTDTQGRIEATLYACDSSGQTRACLLEMQEDGGLYPLVDKG